MSNSDTYDFMKSSVPQSVNDYTPFTDKQWDYKQDQNQGVYATGSGMTQVTFDLNNMFDSSSFVDISEMYLTIPIIMSAAYATAAATIDPTASSSANFSLLALKSGYQHLIHQMAITSNGKTVSDMQPFVNILKHWKLLSSMSATDLKNLAPTLGLSESLDNERSVQYVSTAANTKRGVGLCNNQAFISTVSTDTQVTAGSAQNAGTTNGALQKRVSRIIDTTTNGAAYNNVIGTITSISKMTSEIKPYFTINGNIMTWYDVAIIPLKYINDYINKAGIVRRADLKLVIWVNTGTCTCTVAAAGTTNVNYSAFSSTFSNTLPYTINHVPAAMANGGVPDTTVLIATALSIARPTVTSLGAAAVNLGPAGVAAHAMPACRIYYSKIKLDPVKALTFVQENTAKEIVFENYYFNQYNNTSAGSTFASLVQSGVKNPIGLLVVPFISNTTANVTWNQYASPWDTSPATYAPLSLTNLNVNLGNANVLASSYNYTYENFLQQIVSAESLTSSDIGVNVGLISQSWWEMNRVYYIDLARARSADKDSLRSITLSFTNNNLVAIDLMVFTIFLDKVTMNIETGIVIRD
jgi:hypothetical protein